MIAGLGILVVVVLIASLGFIVGVDLIAGLDFLVLVVLIADLGLTRVPLEHLIRPLVSSVSCKIVSHLVYVLHASFSYPLIGTSR